MSETNRSARGQARGLLAVACAVGAATAASAQTAETEPRGLIGSEASIQVIVENEGEPPRFLGVVHRRTVGPWIEFELGDEPIQNGIYVVAGLIDISEERITGAYPSAPAGTFLETDFNGLVIAFDGSCGVASAEIVEEETSMAFEPDDVFVRDGKLYINVSGLGYGPEIGYAVALTMAPCGVS